MSKLLEQAMGPLLHDCYALTPGAWKPAGSELPTVSHCPRVPAYKRPTNRASSLLSLCHRHTPAQGHTHAPHTIALLTFLHSRLPGSARMEVIPMPCLSWDAWACELSAYLSTSFVSHGANVCHPGGGRVLADRLMLGSTSPGPSAISFSHVWEK